MSSAERCEAIFQEILTLKKIRRTGWQLRGIKECESLADHAFGTAFLAMLLSSYFPELNRDKTIKMAIAHELGECRVGDIPFPALKYFPDKSAIEKEAVSDMMTPLGKSGSDFIELFNEFEDGKTKEAKFVKAVDKLEMLLTASEYEKNGWRGLEDFWQNNSTFSVFSPFPMIEEIALKLKTKHREGKKIQ
ncbi:MAG: HD domain-containing protein [Candidatus Riflebacteria bacterium]|nr:HD domain-containing protein [Candidatus Riflebacteria bacterium]